MSTALNCRQGDTALVIKAPRLQSLDARIGGQVFESGRRAQHQCRLRGPHLARGPRVGVEARDGLRLHAAHTRRVSAPGEA